MLTSENAKVLEEETKVIQASEKTIYETTATVDKLHQEVKDLMTDFQISSNNNTNSMNKVIEGFGSSLQAEKEALSLISSHIKVENVDLNSSIVSNIEKLHIDLAIENKITNDLAEKNQKAKVFSMNLKNATKHNVYLEDERTLVRAFFFEIN